MALNLASGLQVSAHFFWQRRTAAALSHHGVRMEFDPVQRQRASLLLGFVFAVLATALMFVLSWFKPAGQVGQSSILADRDTGATYVLVDGRLHPALNLVSARLIAGQAANPTFVKSAELAKYPQGPTVGIAGAPPVMPMRTGDASQWAVCDTAPGPNISAPPVVTAIGGTLTLGARTLPLEPPKAVLVRHGDNDYVIWGGQRSQIDLSNQAVTLALGLDSGAPEPIEISTALYDALPATEPLSTPAVPGAGGPSRWDVAPDARVGSVLSVRDLQSNSSQFYVLLQNGVQRVSPLVASLLRTADSQGDLLPIEVTPDRLAKVPVVQSLPVDYYPTTRLQFVDTVANPVTCVSWAKGSTDRSAVTTVLSGKGLPIPVSSENHLLQLVKSGPSTGGLEADQVYMSPGATNLVQTTSAAPDATSRESLWWISDQGVRFGIAFDDETLRALGVQPKQARQAPWPLVRLFAAGPALTRPDALTQHDTLDPADESAPLGSRPQ
ncbi:type VII secretion protein EccB [Mycobacterium sp. MYCO198283]|uniref:type VII secretion protein EccB n=1 Tax=Mycobacterium sp. MYCO198283 TaxID=2883505 RepID=UPI001E50C7B8|nr:type VII secretion protein EccB [Mycobacterium sp. MYCO198283]MCG5433049.1 type VII secretion protein EccB [Mycobacterium sp. MYCO198283]